MVEVSDKVGMNVMQLRDALKVTVLASYSLSIREVDQITRALISTESRS